MEFESFQRKAPSINLTALIDVVFILVIFVVLAANFQRVRDIEVNLPSAKSTGDASPQALTLTIQSSGELKLGGKPLGSSELGQELARARTEHEALLILADGEVDFEHAVAALGEAAAAGFQNVSVATREPKP